MQEKIEHLETVEDLTSSDEKVLWKGRRNDKILNFYLIAGLIITVIIAIFFFFQENVEHELGSQNITSGRSIAGLAILIGFILSFSIYYNKQASKYVVTDKKVIIQHGLISGTINYAYYDKIRHLDLSQGLIGSIFNVGTIYIDSGEIITSQMRRKEVRGLNMNPSKPKVVYYAIKNVESPKKIYNLIERMIEKSKEPQLLKELNEKPKDNNAK